MFPTSGKTANMVGLVVSGQNCLLRLDPDVQRIGAVKCDVSILLDRDLRIPKKRQKEPTFEIGPFTCRLQLSKKTLIVDVSHRDTVLSGCEITTRTDTERRAAQNEWT